MRKLPVLGLDDARLALNAMLVAADAKPGRPVALAVVDDHGDLVCFTCMAGANPALARQNALKKAYTSACMRTDSGVFSERTKAAGRTIADLGNPALVLDAGGAVIARKSDGAILGGIGVSGRSSEEDEEIAQAGKAALAAL